MNCDQLFLCQMFAAYVLCTAQDKDAVRLALEQIDVIRRMCTEYPELELATTAAGMNLGYMGIKKILPLS